MKGDSADRIMVPRALRAALGLMPGTRVDTPACETGLRITPGGPTAGLTRDHNGRLVAEGDGSLDDETLFVLIDADRR